MTAPNPDRPYVLREHWSMLDELDYEIDRRIRFPAAYATVVRLQLLRDARLALFALIDEVIQLQDDLAFANSELDEARAQGGESWLDELFERARRL